MSSRTCRQLTYDLHCLKVRWSEFDLTFICVNPQLAKAQKLVAAVPAVLSTIRSPSGGRPAEAAAAPGGVPATPFAGAAGAGGLPPLHRRSPTGGSGASESPDVERLLSRIPSEFRADVARMLLNSQEKAASGYGALFVLFSSGWQDLGAFNTVLLEHVHSVIVWCALSAWWTDLLHCTSLSDVVSEKKPCQLGWLEWGLKHYLLPPSSLTPES